MLYNKTSKNNKYIKISVTLQVSNTFLVIIKRTMMASGTILTVSQKQKMVEILTHHFAFLKRPKVSEIDFIDNFAQCLAIDSKMTQHFFTVFYPELKISSLTIMKVYPKIDVSKLDLFLDIAELVAACGAGEIMRQVPFNSYKFMLLKNPLHVPGKQYSKETLEYSQTKQSNPDFLIKYPNKAFFGDFKATDTISPNTGSYKMISDPDLFETLSKELFWSQIDIIKKLYPGSGLVRKIDDIAKNARTLVNDDWSIAYMDYTGYLTSVLYQYPGLNPSFILKTEGFCGRSKFIEGQINTRSFASQEKTIESILPLFEPNHPYMIKNYFYFKPGVGTTIIKKLNELLKDVYD